MVQKWFFITYLTSIWVVSILPNTLLATSASSRAVPSGASAARGDSEVACDQAIFLVIELLPQWAKVKVYFPNMI